MFLPARKPPMRHDVYAYRTIFRPLMRLPSPLRRIVVFLVSVWLAACGTNDLLESAGAKSVTTNGPNISDEGTDATTITDNSETQHPGGGSATAPKLRALSASGNIIVDDTGQPVILRGLNVGGWLVLEDWMTGITDASDSTGRFAQQTLEARFGEVKTDALLRAWQDSWLTTDDFERMAALGINMIRLPFSWRTLQHPDATFRTDAAGGIDFSRLDWAVREAARFNMYVIPVFHIWDSQQKSYSQISADNNAGAADRSRAAAIWQAVSLHFAGNTTIAAFDLINEPTGSPGNLLQKALYNAVRASDPNRMVIMESVYSNPSTAQWKNVVYSFHEYSMMGTDFADNQMAWQSDVATVNSWRTNFNVPVYVGEFMAQPDTPNNPTLSTLLTNMNRAGFSWSSWMYKGVNNGGWALYNYSNFPRVNLQTDTYDTILTQWKSLGNPLKNSDNFSTYQRAFSP